MVSSVHMVKINSDFIALVGCSAVMKKNLKAKRGIRNEKNSLNTCW